MFLTEVDSRAKLKGSRDPLGIMTLWAYFGRSVVANLTTVSSDVRGFTTLLLGLLIAEELEKSPGIPTLDTFLKFEQFAGYVRADLYNDGQVRGVQRARQRLREQRSKIHISTDVADQLLSNQKVYGLWGYYTNPAEASGLVKDHRLTPIARKFVEGAYIQSSAELKAWTSLLAKDRFKLDPEGRHAPLWSSLGNIMKRNLRKAERSLYWSHLAVCDVSPDALPEQKQLATLMTTLPASKFGFDAFRELIARAAKAKHESLVDYLTQIETIEHLLVPAAHGFGFLQTRGGQTLGRVAGELEKAWGKGLRFVDVAAIDQLRPRIQAAVASEKLTDSWCRLASHLNKGEWTGAVTTLLDINDQVMSRRDNSAPWISIEQGKLRVRNGDERLELIPKEALPDVWKNTYFLDSLFGVVRQIGGEQ